MATWLQRRKAHARLRDDVGLWYHPEYKAEALVETARVPGIEVARGEMILGALGAEGLIRPKHVRPAPLVALGDLAKAHAEAYLDKTARPEYLHRTRGTFFFKRWKVVKKKNQVELASLTLFFPENRSKSSSLQLHMHWAAKESAQNPLRSWPLTG